MVEEITAGKGGVYVAVHVQPGSRRPGVVGHHGGALKIAVAPPPDGGRANQAVVQALAQLLGVPRADVMVVAGHTSRRKTVFARGIGVPDARFKIEAALTEDRNG